MSRILFIEDSKVQAVVAKHLFQKAGYTVDHVPSVEAAVKACYEHPPDLVISDQVLGEGSGLEVCRRMKSDVQLSVIPVLILTGSRHRKHHVAALDAGADAFLSKDSSSEELLAVISHLLQNTVRVQPSVAGQEDANLARRRARILVVDDSPTFLARLCQKLSESGFEVSGANSGDEGLSLLSREAFDVAVTDVLMPEMDGFEFAKQARRWADANQRQLGVLVMTGTERKDVLIQSLDSGADDYVSKVQDMDVIVAHTTALARRVARTRQIESMNKQAARKELDLRETELKRQQAEERARLVEELENANQTLGESNDRLQRFAHFASHELRTPLDRVIRLAELLRERTKDRLDEECGKTVDEIIETVREMQTLVANLPDDPHVTAGEPPPERTERSAGFDDVASADPAEPP